MKNRTRRLAAVFLYVFKNAAAQFDTGIPMDEAVMEYVQYELDGDINHRQYGETRHDQTQIAGIPDTVSLAEAFAAVSTGGADTLLALDSDTTLAETAHVKDGQVITLDLAGHTLTVTESGGFAVEGGSLTVADSGAGGAVVSPDSRGAVITQTGGCVNYTGGSLSAAYAGPAEKAGEQPAVSVRGMADFNLSGGSISVTNGTGVSLRGEAVSGEESGEDDGGSGAEAGFALPVLTMTGGRIRAAGGGTGGTVSGVYAYDAGLDVSGGGIEAEGRDAVAVHFEKGPGADAFFWDRVTTLLLRGGVTLRAVSEREAVGVRMDKGTGFVYNAEITAEGEIRATAVEADAGYLSLSEQEGGLRVTARSASGSADAVRAEAVRGVPNEEGLGTIVSISGGRFTGSVLGEWNGEPLADNNLLLLSGGVYTVRPDDAYLAEMAGADGQLTRIARIVEKQEGG